MSIFSRLSDIVNSNLNALLDKAEDPEKMVRLIIQEMEETLVEVRTTSARAIADKKELARRLEWLEQEAGEWERKAEVAINKGRDDLAKSALGERNKAQETQVAVNDELKLIETTLANLAQDTQALQAKIKDAKARQNAIILRGNAARTRLDVREKLADHNIDDAIARFELYERKMDDLEGQVEAYDMVQKTLAEEIDDLENDELLDDQLAELKRRVSGSAGDRQTNNGSGNEPQ